MKTYYRDSYEGAGAIAAERRAPRSAPAPMFSRRDSPELRLGRRARVKGHPVEVLPGVRVTRLTDVRAPVITSGIHRGRIPMGAIDVTGDRDVGAAGGSVGVRPPIAQIGQATALAPVMSFSRLPVSTTPTPVLSTSSSLGTRTPTGIMTAPPVRMTMPVQIGSGIGQAAPVPVKTGIMTAPSRVRPASAEYIGPMTDLELTATPVTPVSPMRSKLPIVLGAVGIAALYLLLRKKRRTS